MLDAASHIINKNKEQVDAKEGTPFLSLSTQQTTATETPGKCESEIQNQQQIEILSRLELIETAISSLQDFSRLELIETALSFVHDDNDKSTEDISEIKQWRDNFVTEQSDMRLKIEQMTKKQNQDFKNLRKQMSEQDNKVKELNKEIESLKETETKSNKTLEKLSLDMKEYENILLKINKEIQDHSDKTDSITQEIKRHSDEIVSLQEDNNKIMVNVSTNFEKLRSKHSVVYKLVQQRLMLMDKLIQILNQNLDTREERIKKLRNIENIVYKLSNDFNQIDTPVYKGYVCHAQLASNTHAVIDSKISTFRDIREFNGHHFDQTTGTFVSPHDGLYLVSVTLHEYEYKRIRVGVWAGGMWCMSVEVKYADTSAAGSVVVDMKKGQELYLYVILADKDAKLSYYSSFTIVSL